MGRVLYWVGGGSVGWYAGHFSLSSGGSGSQPLPTKDDDVIFDANSGPAGYVVSSGGVQRSVHGFNCSAASGLRLTDAAIIVYGDLILGAGTSVELGFVMAGSSNQNLASNGCQIKRSMILSSHGAVNLLDDFIILAPNGISHRSGGVKTNNYSFSVGFFTSNISGSTTGRALDLGTSAVSVAGVTLGWNLSDGPAYASISANASTIQLTGTPGAGGVAFKGGSADYGTLNFNYDSTSNVQIGGIVNVGTATFTGSVAYLLASNLAVGSLTIAGSTSLKFRSDITGTQRTVTAAGFSLSGVAFRDITAAGSIPWSGTDLVDEGGNTNITF